MRHIFTSPFSRRTNRAVKTIRRPVSIKVYQDELTEKIISFTDVEVVKFQRNKKIELFFEIYECKHRYTLIEYVIDHNDNEKLDRFFFALKKALKENGSGLLGYIRIVDIGENGGVHHHIVIAIPFINVKGKKLPKHLKRTFNGSIVHGELVKNKERKKNYYLPKNIVELGIRKRTFVKSHKYKELPNQIQNKKSTNL